MDATIYNIPWYLMYCFNGFPIYHLIIKKGTTVYRHFRELGVLLKESKIKGHVYIEDNNGLIIKAINYHYTVNDDSDSLNDWLKFAILKPDEERTDTLLYKTVDEFSVSVDSYYFGNLIEYENWKCNENLLKITDGQNH